MSDHVTCRREGAVAHVRLNRPEKLNSLTLSLLEGLVATAQSLMQDRDLRGVLIAGEGRSFSAGLDILSVLGEGERFMTLFAPDEARGTNLYQEACWAWRRLPVPVVAAVHGHCFGGGLQLALAADFRFTTPDAQWSILETKWGLVPDMSGVRALSEQVGLDVAKRLTMTGEVISGVRAVELGLASEVAQDPYAAGLALLEQIATRSPDAVRAAKRLFDTTWFADERTTFAAERAEQAYLLTAENTRIAQQAGMTGEPAAYRPRGN